MKKIILLSILCAISLITMAQNDSFTFDEKKYQLLGGDSVELIDGYIGSTYYNYQVAIPETIHVNIKNQTYYGQEIVGDYRVVSIGAGAFEADYSRTYGRLSQVRLPKSIRKIGKNAFKNTDLAEFEIPLNVDSIGENAFSGCTKLKTIYNFSKFILVQRGSSEYGGICENATEVYNNVVEVNHLTDLVWCRDSIAYFLARHINNYREYMVLPQEYNGETYYIADNAFKDKTKLKHIVIPEGPSLMGKSVFSGCTALQYISLPASMTQIGENAFSGCDALDTIIVAEGNPHFDSRSNCNCLINTQSQTLLFAGGKSNIVPEGVKIIDKSAFANHKFLTEIQLPSSIEYIGYNAFAQCTKLTTINIPDSVKQIYPYTFNGCSSLSKIDLPQNLTIIDNYAFYNCGKLPYLIVPSNLDSIGTNAFYGCKSLNTIYNFSKLFFIRSSQDFGCIAAYASEVYNNVDEMDDEFLWIKENDIFVIAKYWGHNSSLSLPDTHKGLGYRLGDNLFSGSLDLRTISLSENTFSIGSYAFYGCSNLNNINLPSNIDNIGDAAFSGCCSLTTIEIPNNIVTIGNYVFANCSSLTSIAIPNSVTNIGSYAFNNCTSLASVTIPNRVTNIGESAFAGCRSISAISLPNSITTLGKSVFESCTSLNSVTIPSSVTSIGESAFAGCSSLASINIPNTITYFSNRIFSGCSSLKSIAIPNSVTNIGSYAFNNCTSLASVTIPNNVTNIKEYAFYGCAGITKLIIGCNVNSIGNYAFANCRNFDDITCYATIVPTITAKTFDNIGNKNYIYLYVPEGRERAYSRDEYWGEFDIKVKEAEQTTETLTDVKVEPSENEVIISWPKSDNADTYELVITKDGVVFCTLAFNANGQLTGIAFAPSRNADNSHASYAAQTSNGGLRFTVTGLLSGTNYHLELTTKDTSNKTIATYNANFKTLGDNDEGIEEIQSDQSRKGTKILLNGHIYILRGEKVYTLTGQDVK